MELIEVSVIISQDNCILIISQFTRVSEKELFLSGLIKYF